MNYTINTRRFNISLEDLLGRLNKKQIQTFLHTFSCSLEPEVEIFLHNNAIDFQEYNICRSYIIAGIEEDNTDRIHLLGYSPLR